MAFNAWFPGKQVKGRPSRLGVEGPRTGDLARAPALPALLHPPLTIDPCRANGLDARLDPARRLSAERMGLLETRPSDEN
jgi:hypothetical protein